MHAQKWSIGDESNDLIPEEPVQQVESSTDIPGNQYQILYQS